MTQQQKRGLTVISVILVGLTSVYLTWLSIAVMGSSLQLGSHQPGRVFMLAIYNWSGLSIILKSLPGILALGIIIFANYKLKDWQFFALVLLSVIGIAACIYLFLEVSTTDTARKFWAYSPVEALDNYDAFVSKAQVSLAAAGAWLLSILGIQLGVKLT